MPASDSAGKSSRVLYKHTATLQEDLSTSGPEATWSVQFALPPSLGHRAGGGRCWFSDPSGFCNTSSPSTSEQLCGTADISRSVDSAHRGYDVPEVINLDGDVESRCQNVTEIAVRIDGSTDSRPPNVETEIGWTHVFATCNEGTVRVYQARHGDKPLLLQGYEDPDAEETFFSVAWTFNVNGRSEWWLVAAGKRGILRVLNVSKRKLELSLTGHGESINDVKTHPRDPALILTASKDESLRLWNLRTSSTLAVFAGLRGHRGEVLYADFNSMGTKFASCGIDNSIRLWDVDADEKIVAAIKETHHAADRGITDVCVYLDESGQRRKAKVPMIQFPIYVTHKVHKHYVDCVMWVGDLLLSKSVHNRMLLWEPKGDRESLASPANDYTVLEEYLLDNCGIWFIRFGMDRARRFVACGNERGLVTVFQLDEIPSRPLCVLSSNGKQGKDTCFVRQCAFSDDGTILLAVDDHSCIVQYELVP